MGDFSVLSKIINGGISSIIGISILFPLDLVKTRIQLQKLDLNAPKISFVSFFRATLKTEGLLGMYRGSSVSYALVTPEKALYLASNDFFRDRLSSQSPQPLSLGKSILAGALAAISTLTLQTPMELVKIRMQAAHKKSRREETSAMSIILDILRQKGISGMYQGLAATGCRDLVFSCVLFPLMASIEERGPKSSQKMKSCWSFLAGSVAGSVAAFVTTPFDVIKTRLQMAHLDKTQCQYSGIWDAGYKIYRTEGTKALFKGGLLRVLILMPMFGIMQMVYLLNISENILGIGNS